MAEILGKQELTQQIEGFTLVPSDGGRFEFSVNGELLYSKKQTGRHAEPGEIAGLLQEWLQEKM